MIRPHEAITTIINSAKLSKEVLSYKRSYKEWAVAHDEQETVPPDLGYALISSLACLSHYFGVEAEKLHANPLFPIGVKMYRYMFDIEDSIIDDLDFREKVRSEQLDFSTYKKEVESHKVNGLSSNDFFYNELPEKLIGQEELLQHILLAHDEWLKSEYNSIINDPETSFLDHARQRIQNATVFPAIVLAEVLMFPEIKDGYNFSTEDKVFIEESSRIATMIDELLDVGEDANNGETSTPIACAKETGEWEKMKLFIKVNPSFTLSLVGRHRKLFPKTIFLWEKTFKESLEKLRGSDQKTADSLLLLAYSYPVASQIPHLRQLLPVTSG